MTGDNWYDYYSCLYEPDTGPPHARKSRNANDAAGGGLSRCQTKEVRFSAGDLFHGKEEP